MKKIDEFLEKISREIEEKRALYQKPSLEKMLFPAIEALSRLMEAESDFILSIREMAKFFGCTNKTVKNWIRLCRIPFIQKDDGILFYFPDVLEAIRFDPVVRNQFLKKINAEPIRPVSHSKISNPQEIKIETELYPDRFVEAKIKYQGWRCFVCFPYHLWNQKLRVNDFIQQIILDRHAKHPFPIPPDFNPSLN